MAIPPLKLEFTTREYHVRDVIPVDLSGIALSDASHIVARVLVRTSPDPNAPAVKEPPQPIANGAWEDYNPVGAEPTPISFTPYHAGYFQVTLVATTTVGHNTSVVTFHTPIVEVVP